MKWLITGGCGFVGSNLANELLAKGTELAVLDDLSRLGSERNLEWLRKTHGNGWRFFQVDVRDGESIDKVMQDYRPTMVAHLAGQVAATTSLEHPKLDFEINALGTLNVLEALRKYSPGSAIAYSSTNKVYGSLAKLRFQQNSTRYQAIDFPDGLDEATPLDGSTPYGCSKLSAEQYVKDYSRVFGLRSVVFRHSSMYGGRQFASFDQGWIGWFCQKGLEQASDSASPAFSIAGDGKQVRDLLHAEDLVACYVLAAERMNSVSGEVFNIGGGMANSMSLLELFAELGLQLNLELRYFRTPERIADQKLFVADCRKAEKLLGWKPGVSSKEGIRRMLQWCKEAMASK